MQTAHKDCLTLGAKLTDAQYASLRTENRYLNVHTAAHPGGELRAQLKP